MSFKYKMSEALNLEPDIVAGTMILYFHDNRYARVENFTSILEFDACLIKFQGKNGRVCIEGENLQIQQYSAIECNIKGRIQRISYEMNT